MTLFDLSRKKEIKIIRLGMILFWWLFWLLNVIDKFILDKIPFWVGKNRVAQFIDYFASVGIDDVAVPIIFFIFVTFLEIIALLFLTIAIWFYYKAERKHTRAAFFYGVLTSLVIFSFFTIGDQIFGDRVELLEHSTYWSLLILSWFVYVRVEKRKEII